jgi:hypothetical protein
MVTITYKYSKNYETVVTLILRCYWGIRNKIKCET